MRAARLALASLLPFASTHAAADPFAQIRAEAGMFTGDPGLAGMASVRASAGVLRDEGPWELALGARIDAARESGSSLGRGSRLDYTENYLRWRSADTRLTLGTQHLPWGRVDEVPPVDRLARIDFSRAFVDRLPERRRAVPALRLERFADGVKADLVWVPVFVPAVMPDPDSVWSPVDTRSGRIIGMGAVPIITGARIVEDGSGSGGAGFRITRTGGGLDFGASLQRARQSLPYYRASLFRLTEVHPYSWVAGGELETSLAGATWRMEAAWSSDVPVTGRLLLDYHTEPAIDAVLGVELFLGDRDTRVTLQLAGHRTRVRAPVLDRAEYYHLYGEIEHPLARGRWRASLRFAVGLDARDVYVNPRLSYHGFDRHELFITGHVFSGAPQTLGGFYRRNDLVSIGWQTRF